MTLIEHIRKECAQKHKMLVRLIDPDKVDIGTALSGFDYIFVGGSTSKSADEAVIKVRHHTDSPILLFPGSVTQFTDKVDALLYLSLLNSRDAEWLIGQHIASARAIAESGTEVIPMGYILIEGGQKSSVEIVTKCTPLPTSDPEKIIDTAIAGQLLGKQLIYLEAGSGAKHPIPQEIIRAVREVIDIPLIVGGGITTIEQLLSAYDAGADIIVIGNHFERYSEDIPKFLKVVEQYNQQA